MTYPGMCWKVCEEVRAQVCVLPKSMWYGMWESL